jgi:hypothetical protein
MLDLSVGVAVVEVVSIFRTYYTTPLRTIAFTFGITCRSVEGSPEQLTVVLRIFT